MLLAPISIACPQCGSPDVVYSCKPDCCFNHVCSKCYTTFQTATVRTGELQGEIAAVPPDPDPSGPTAACARCGEITLFAIAEDGERSGTLLCFSCKALLMLEIIDIEPG